jgi:hypothetical protein
MEEFLKGGCRPEVQRFLLAFENFLLKFGKQPAAASEPLSVPAAV